MTQEIDAKIILDVYETIFHSTSDGIFIADSERIILDVNPAAAMMFTLPPEDIIGNLPSKVFKGNRPLVSLFLNTEDQTLDVYLPQKRIAVGSTITLPDKRRIVLLRDVTEQRDLDNRREGLLRAIAHDFRNPISAISGFVDLIDRFGELNDRQQKFLLRIKQTTTKLHDMAASLVDLGWIEAGMPQEHVPIRLGDLIEQTIHELAIFANDHGVKIAFSVQKPLPLVMGDPKRFQMVVYELLKNAIMYSSPESNIVVHAWGNEKNVNCSIADQGFGISEEEQDLVFDRMYRSKDERVMEQHGGGLGLTLVRTILNQHGGQITLHSTLNIGSTFMITLPAVQI